MKGKKRAILMGFFIFMHIKDFKPGYPIITAA